MHPKPKRLLELLNSIEVLVAPTPQKIEEDERILEYIKTQKSTLFINDDWFEAHFRVGLYFKTLSPYYGLITEIVEDISFHRGIETATLKESLLDVHKKLMGVYFNESYSHASGYFDYDRVISGSLNRLEKSIETIGEDTTSPYVLHLPHAGISIPEQYRDDYLLDESELRENVYQYADYKTDEISICMTASLKFNRVVNSYSRLFMDPERFFDDTQESMQVKHGLGWFYENAILEKKPLRTTRNKVSVAPYYHDHHNRLEYVVEHKLKHFDTCTIIDCHSFSNERYWFHDATLDLPDICIGFDAFHKDDVLVDTIKEVFKDYKVSINTPYAGSMVPTKYYMKDARVKSVMIEINKKLYLEEDNTTLSAQHREIFSKLCKIAELVDVPYK